MRTSTQQHRTTRKLKAAKRKTSRGELLPGVLGSAPTQIFRAEEPAVGAEKNLAERTWDQRVADLHQRAAATILGRSGHRVSDTKGLSRPEFRQHCFFHEVMACPGFSSCLVKLPNVDLEMGLFRIFSCHWKNGSQIIFLYPSGTGRNVP